MPLTRKVTFRSKLQKGERVQVPKMIRWEFKVEPSQFLKVGFTLPDKFKGWQFFYARMEKAGRIYIPNEILSIWQDEKSSMQGCIVEVTLEPT